MQERREETMEEHISAEMEMAERLRAFEGKWVAISDRREVVANADTVGELLTRLKGVDYEGMFHVFEGDYVWI